MRHDIPCKPLDLCVCSRRKTIPEYGSICRLKLRVAQIDTTIIRPLLFYWFVLSWVVDKYRISIHFDSNRRYRAHVPFQLVTQATSSLWSRPDVALKCSWCGEISWTEPVLFMNYTPLYSTRFLSGVFVSIIGIDSLSQISDLQARCSSTHELFFLS